MMSRVLDFLMTLLSPNRAGLLLLMVCDRHLDIR